MPQILVVDSRLPEPADIPKSDPASPANIVLNTKKLQAQCAADAKYDIDPPQRIDPFMDYSAAAMDSKTAVIFAAVVFAFIVLVVPHMVFKRTLPLWARIGGAVVAIYGLHYLAGKFEKRTV